MRPTRKGAIVALLAALLFVAGSTAQAGWLFVIASGLLGVLVYSLMARHHLRWIAVEREMPKRVRVGDDVLTTVKVHNFGTRPTPMIRIVDHFDAFAEPVYVCGPLLPKVSALLAPSITATTRGVYPGGTVEVTTGAPFGLKRSARTIDVASPLTVVPRWVDLRSFPLLEPSSFPRERLHERARVGNSDELFGTREYRRGDPFRAIHWKSSAHAGHLIVREYQQQAAGRVVLTIWGGQSGDEPDTDFEMLVSSAASIGRYALATGHRVDLGHVFDGEVRVGADLTQDSLLDELARVQPATDRAADLFATVSKRAGKRATVIAHLSSADAARVDVGSVLHGIESAGNRVILVTARSSSWARSVDEVPVEELLRVSRVARVLERGEDLRACLETS